MWERERRRRAWGAKGLNKEERCAMMMGFIYNERERVRESERVGVGLCVVGVEGVDSLLFLCFVVRSS